MPGDIYKADDVSTFGGYLKHAWNVFRNKDPIPIEDGGSGYGYAVGSSYSIGHRSYARPDHRRLYGVSDKTIAGAIYNRIAVDASAANLHHVRVDENDMFKEEINSGLNNVLRCEANIDQTGRGFIQDFVWSILEEGVAAAVPVDTSVDPNRENAFDIHTMRVGRLVGWEPRIVSIEVYNDRTGNRETIKMAKTAVGIVENPFYSVMNEPNSTLKRLTSKLALLDSIDDDIGSKKLDVIIQLPYVVKNQTKLEQANERRRQLEKQLEESRLGVGYIDGTERVIQLNRSLENNIMGEVEYLTSMLYSQLGLTAEIMNGTASESVMTNYYKRTVDVILQAICDEFERKFLTKTARTQRQAIQFYREPFSLTPTTAIAEVADKFTRNEILSPNEIRSMVGFMPSTDEAANELRNRNISQSAEQAKGFAMANGGGEGSSASQPGEVENGVSIADLLS